MGEIADSLLDGEYDYQTGEYIGEGVGFPRTLNNKGKKEYSPYYCDVINMCKQVTGVEKRTGFTYIQEYGLLKTQTDITVICNAIYASKESKKEFKEWLKTKKKI